MTRYTGYIEPSPHGLSLYTADGDLVASCQVSKKKSMINLARELECGPYYKGQINPATQPDRFSAEELLLFESGKCCWQTAYGLPGTEYCEQPSEPQADFGYCLEHYEEYNERTNH